MNKLSMSLLSALSLFTLTSDAFSAPVRATPARALCSAPRVITPNTNVFVPRIASFGSEQRIYYSLSNMGSGTKHFEINPGRDKIFGTRDDSERSVTSLVAEVYEDLAWVSYLEHKTKLLKPGPDNVLFTADDSEILIPNLSEFSKNGDLFAWLDRETEEIKACDQSILTGPGACTEDSNHWAVPMVINNELVVEIGNSSQPTFLPTKQVINGQTVPMVIAFFNSSGPYPLPRVIMMNSGFSFPLTQIINPDAIRLFNMDISGNNLYSSAMDVLGQYHLVEWNIDYNSPHFMTKKTTLTDGEVRIEDSRTNNSSAMPTYLSSNFKYVSPNWSYNIITYNDTSRGVTAQIPVQYGSINLARDVKDKVVVIDMNYHPTLGAGWWLAVSHCP